MADRDGRVGVQEQHRERPPDDQAPADDDGARSGDRDPVLAEQPHHATGRSTDECLPAEEELSAVERMQAVDVLHRIERAHHPGLVDVLG